MKARPRVVLVGGPDVDHRLALMDALSGEFELAAVGSSPELAPRFAERGYTYRSYHLSRRFDLWADARSAWELRRILSELDPDGVHAFDTKPAIVGRLGAWLAGVPVVLATLPGLGALYTYDTPRVRRRRAVIEKLHRLASKVSRATVFQNRGDLEEMVTRRVVAREKAVLIAGSGVERGRFDAVASDGERRRQARRALGVGDGAEVVLSVGRLLRSKGFEDLAAAARLLRAGRPRLRVLVAGPEDPEALDALDPAELGDGVDWLGARSDVPELLAAADVFAFPSTYREGVPRVLVEAAFAGVPIVAADAVGGREVVDDGATGLLVPPHRPELLAAALEKLLDRRELARRLATACRERALERFELGAIAREHRRLYHRLLAEARVGSRTLDRREIHAE